MKITWKKRFVSATLALTMLLSFLPANLFPVAAAVSEGSGYDIEFVHNEGEFYIHVTRSGGDVGTRQFAFAVMPNFSVKKNGVVEAESNPFEQVIGPKWGDMAVTGGGGAFASYYSGGPIYWHNTSLTLNSGDRREISFSDFTCKYSDTGEDMPLLTIENIEKSLSGQGDYSADITTPGEYPYVVVMQIGRAHV